MLEAEVEVLLLGEDGWSLLTPSLLVDVVAFEELGLLLLFFAPSFTLFFVFS
ncbi:MAG: hypothetical protein LC105_09505 [Chitinophagales bacterium]|nr:hypothetical protein [Chitinophagales bacterium]